MEGVRRWSALAGCALALGGPSVALAAPGDLDPSFGDGGTSRFDLGVHGDPNPGNSGGLAAALQGSGRLLIAGWSGDEGGTNSFLLVGVDEHGHLDPAFGDGGVVRTAVGCGSDVAHAMAVQADGRIVLGGAGACSGNANECCAELARYLPDGRLDASFGTPQGARPAGSIVQDDLGMVRGVAVQGDGIVAAGIISNPPNLEGFVERMTPAGQRDGGFGSNGIAHIHAEDATDLYGAAVDAQRRVLVTGVAGPSYPRSGRSFPYVERLTPDGHPDTSFGNSGVAQLPQDPNLGSSGSRIAVLPDGRIIVAGTQVIEPYGDTALVLWRLSASGAADPSFGDGGRLVVPTSYSAEPGSVSALADGTLLLAGDESPGHGYAADPMILHLSADGRILWKTDAPGSGSFGGAAVDASGRIWAGGTVVVTQRNNSDDTGVLAARLQGSGPVSAGAGGAGAAGSTTASGGPSGSPSASRSRTLHCVVPDLRRHTLAAARRMLARHHCRVGRISAIGRRHRRRAIVVAQHPRPHRRLHARARVRLVVKH